jgi:hypothetical protein
MENKALKVFEQNKKLLKHQENIGGKTPFAYYEFFYNELVDSLHERTIEELISLAAACRAMLIAIASGQLEPRPPRQPFRPKIVK